jgi:hypothetical protein
MRSTLRQLLIKWVARGHFYLITFDQMTLKWYFQRCGILILLFLYGINVTGSNFTVKFLCNFLPDFDELLAVSTPVSIKLNDPNLLWIENRRRQVGVGEFDDFVANVVQLDEVASFDLQTGDVNSQKNEGGKMFDVHGQCLKKMFLAQNDCFYEVFKTEGQFCCKAELWMLRFNVSLWSRFTTLSDKNCLNYYLNVSSTT